MKRIITVLFILSLCLSANAIKQTISFIPFSLDKGLTHSRVQCIFQDHTGVVWIGTKNGLNSWDQSELKTYFHIPSDSNSLPDNYIRFITEGSDQKLYLSTNKGVGTFNPVSRQFTQIMHEEKAFDSGCCLPTDSLLLLGSHETIYAYHYHKKTLTPLAKEIKGDLNKCINRILVWDKNTFIASTKYDGIWMYNVQSQTMSRCPFVQERKINNIFVDSKGSLYVSVYGSGVFRYQHDGTPDGHFCTQNGQLNHDVVSDFSEKDNVIWMGTDGGGINLLDLHTNKVGSIKHIPGDPHSLPNNSIFCLYKDQKDNIWGGSVHSGLFAITKNHIQTYKDTPPNVPYGLSEITVTSLYEDTDTLLWIGTDGGGLNTYNPHTGLFRHIPSTNGKKIVSITSFSKHELLVSCFNDGLYLFNKFLNKLTPFPLINLHTTRQEFTKGDLINLYTTHDKIYIFGFHIYVYNRKNRQILQLPTPSNLASEQLMNAQPIHADDKYIYILSYNSLLQIDKMTENITPLFCVHNNEALSSACIDNQGNFWIGSKIALYHYITTQHRINKIENVLFNDIQSLTSDNKGRIWIGANNLLLAYLTNEKRTIILDETDGVKPNGYIFTPMSISRSNNIYMGGTQGLTVIHKNIDISDQYMPIVNLLSLSLDGKDITYKAMKEGVLNVPYKHSSISFKVIVNESTPFRKHLFNYKLEGDEPRNIQSDSRKIELGILKPGNYTLLANCSANNNWSETTQLIHIHVQSPIWQKSWFIILCILLLLIGCICIIWMLQKRMDRKLKQALAKNKKDQEENLRFITRLNDLIDNNIDKPDLDSQFLQNEMAMGRTSLYNKLKQTTGMGMSEYINQRKIEKAVNLLLNTNLSISEISDRLGFSYQRYFSTLFKKIKGVSPSQFRNQNENE